MKYILLITISLFSIKGKAQIFPINWKDYEQHLSWFFIDRSSIQRSTDTLIVLNGLDSNVIVKIDSFTFWIGSIQDASQYGFLCAHTEDCCFYVRDEKDTTNAKAIPYEIWSKWERPDRWADRKDYIKIDSIGPVKLK